MSSLFAVALFLSAALLFAVQPLVARMLLPRFGGTPAVWNTCMVFFQAVLLAGYAYVHLLTQRLNLRRQIAWHCGLLLLALLMTPLLLLPLGYARNWSFMFGPILTLLAILTVSIGVPFFALSATAPLLQKWFTRTLHYGSSDPYFLYSASNFGSMLALLSYPVVFEPNLSLWTQGLTWAAGVVLLVLLVVRCALLVRRNAPPSEGASLEILPPEIGIGRKLRWLGLAFVPSSLLFGVTTFLSTDIASVPLLWVLPLSVYLLSFIVVFARRPPITHSKVLLLFPVAVLWQTFVFALRGPITLVFVLHLFTLFIVALACHGELARLRPSTRHLTSFYLWLAAGGVLGGMFNVLLAPLIFSGLVEYPLALVLACFFVVSEEAPPAKSKLDWHDMWVPLLLLIALTTFGPSLKSSLRDEPLELRLPVLVTLLYGLPAALVYFFRARPVRFGLCVGALLVAAAMNGGLADSRNTLHEVYRSRSFYGVVRVLDVTDPDDPSLVFRQFIHGSTLHGLERISDDAEVRRKPLSYYFDTGPIGDLFKAREGKDHQIAVLGLGAGSLASYAEPKQVWTFYELDPTVQFVAEEYFNFLKGARARGASVEIKIDDARLALEAAPDDQRFDLLFADAFSSDAVPVHLLSREAFEVYRKHLAPGGLLVVNITNRHLDLEPVLADLAADAQMHARICEEREAPADAANQAESTVGIVTAEEKKQGKAPSRWVVLAENEADLGKLADNPRWRLLQQRPGSRVWTDDYSNLFRILRW